MKKSEQAAIAALKKQIAALSPEEAAKLLAKLNGDNTPPRVEQIKAETVKQPQKAKKSKYTPEEKAAWKANVGMSAAEVIRKILASERYKAVEKFCEIRGAWVWAIFPKKPTDEVRAFLKSLGFQFNAARSNDISSVWQHAGGKFCRKSDGDPREKYGSMKPQEYLQKVEVGQ